MSPEYNDIIHELLVKYLLGEATPDEQDVVQAWIAESPENERQYRQFKTVWEESRHLAATRTVDEHAAWQRMKARLQDKPQPAKVVPARTGFYWMRIAALFIVLAGSLWWVYSSRQQRDAVQMLAVQAINEPKIDTLPDGSVVTLNMQSQITYPSRFEGGTRTITLKGEAFFNVTPNKDKPFIINVNDVTVRVVGTSFNIRSEGGKTEVIVETGVVEVIRNHQVATLRPKEKIVVAQQDTVLKKEEVNDQLYNYYRTKEFVCDNTPLWKMVEVLNEAYGSNIVIGRASLRNLPLTATFNNESLDQVLTIISQTFDIEVVKEEEKIVLR